MTMTEKLASLDDAIERLHVTQAFYEEAARRVLGGTVEQDVTQ